MEFKVVFNNGTETVIEAESFTVSAEGLIQFYQSEGNPDMDIYVNSSEVLFIVPLRDS
jgi:hypothetical protein